LWCVEQGWLYWWPRECFFRVSSVCFDPTATLQ
jgi:hypothetical protein